MPINSSNALLIVFFILLIILFYICLKKNKAIDIYLLTFRYYEECKVKVWSGMENNKVRFRQLNSVDKFSFFVVLGLFVFPFYDILFLNLDSSEELASVYVSYSLFRHPLISLDCSFCYLVRYVVIFILKPTYIFLL